MKPAAILLLLLSASSSAQIKQGKARQDSLLSELPGIQDDSNGVMLLVDISFGYCASAPVEGIAYGRRALALAQIVGWKKGEALAYNELGNSHRNKAAYPLALDYFFKSLRIHESLGDRLNTGVVSGNIGTVYFYQGNYKKALEYYFRSLKDAQTTGNQVGQLTTLGNIGNVYYEQAAYREALVYMEKALGIAEELNDKRGIINQSGNIGNVHGELGEYAEALTWYFKTLRIAESEDDRQIIAANEGNIGETYLDIARDTAKTRSAAYRSANLSKAVTYLQKGISHAREVHFNEAVFEFSHKLSEAYVMLGDFRLALEAYQQHIALKDSTFNLENNEKIAGLETARAIELKDKDIQIARLEVAKKRNERWFFHRRNPAPARHPGHSIQELQKTAALQYAALQRKGSQR